MSIKKTIVEIFGTGAAIVNGYLRIPKANWTNITPTSSNSANQMLLAITEKAANTDSTVSSEYKETIVSNDKINNDNISGIYNRYLIKATGINKAKNFNPSDY